MKKPICTTALSLLLFTTDAAYAKPPACTSNCVQVHLDIEAKNPDGGGVEIIILKDNEELRSRQCPTFNKSSVCILKAESTTMFSQGEEIIVRANRMYKIDSLRFWEWTRVPLVIRRIPANIGTWSLDQEGLKTKITVTRI